MSVKQQQNVVSVDIGQSSLNMAFTTGNGIISKAATANLQEGVVQNMRLRSPDQLTAALMEAKYKSKINEKTVFYVWEAEKLLSDTLNFLK